MLFETGDIKQKMTKHLQMLNQGKEHAKVLAVLFFQLLCRWEIAQDKDLRKRHLVYKSNHTLDVYLFLIQLYNTSEYLTK